MSELDSMLQFSNQLNRRAHCHSTVFNLPEKRPNCLMSHWSIVLLLDPIQDHHFYHLSYYYHLLYLKFMKLLLYTYYCNCWCLKYR